MILTGGLVFRANSTSPNNQSNKMNSIVYQKQFQSAAAAVRMTQPFPAQFAPQVGNWWLPTNKSVFLCDPVTLNSAVFPQALSWGDTKWNP